jgi:hypothetical protein
LFIKPFLSREFASREIRVRHWTQTRREFSEITLIWLSAAAKSAASDAEIVDFQLRLAALTLHSRLTNIGIARKNGGTQKLKTWPRIA